MTDIISFLKQKDNEYEIAQNVKREEKKKADAYNEKHVRPKVLEFIDEIMRDTYTGAPEYRLELDLHNQQFGIAHKISIDFEKKRIIHEKVFKYKGETMTWINDVIHWITQHLESTRLYASNSHGNNIIIHNKITPGSL